MCRLHEVRDRFGAVVEVLSLRRPRRSGDARRRAVLDERDQDPGVVGNRRDGRRVARRAGEQRAADRHVHRRSVIHADVGVGGDVYVGNRPRPGVARRLTASSDFGPDIFLETVGAVQGLFLARPTAWPSQCAGAVVDEDVSDQHVSAGHASGFVAR